MSNAVAKHEKPEAPAPVSVTPMDMLNRAVSSGASLEMIEKLMTLQERWEAGQARKAFDAAISAAKAKISPIQRNATGHNSKRYADFSAIAQVVDPILSAHGLSYRFRTTQGERISVTCVLSHRDGHSEETTLTGPADASGNKNAIQAIGSTLTYLQRYSLVQMLGLAAATDDDGKAAGVGETISDDQLKTIRDLMKVTSTAEPRFCGYMKVEKLEDIPAKSYQRAIDALNAKKQQAAS